MSFNSAYDYPWTRAVSNKSAGVGKHKARLCKVNGGAAVVEHTHRREDAFEHRCNAIITILMKCVGAWHSSMTLTVHSTLKCY
eukprot:364277-Chlamydomonas_euryale.AAC.17